MASLILSCIQCYLLIKESIEAEITLKVGISLPQAGEQATRENVLHIAKNAESEGFDSLWVFERLLWPLKPQTPYPASPDGSLPTFSQNVFDPLGTLTYVAAKTNKIALGTSVIDMLFHNPVILAKRFATLDVLSEGRAIAGLGIGWSKDEYQASNIPVKDRGQRADEFLQALKRIWTEDVIEFKGKFYNIPGSKIGPKPIQKPHIPIYMGGFSPNTFSRIVNYDTNGWIGPIGGPLEYLGNTVKTIRDIANKANKDPNRFKVILFTYPDIDSGSENQSTLTTNQDKRLPLTGTIDQAGSDIERIRHMGIDHIMFGHIGRNLDNMLDVTKQLAKFAR